MPHMLGATFSDYKHNNEAFLRISKNFEISSYFFTKVNFFSLLALLKTWSKVTLTYLENEVKELEPSSLVVIHPIGRENCHITHILLWPIFDAVWTEMCRNFPKIEPFFVKKASFFAQIVNLHKILQRVSDYLFLQSKAHIKAHIYWSYRKIWRIRILSFRSFKISNFTTFKSPIKLVLFHILLVTHWCVGTEEQKIIYTRDRYTQYHFDAKSCMRDQ